MARRRLRYKNAYIEASEPSRAGNLHILAWWGEVQDAAVRQAIADYEWGWPSETCRAVETVTDPGVLELWRETDPICKQFDWHNVLLHFCVARAIERGWDKDAVQPEWFNCLRCGQDVREDQMPRFIRSNPQLRAELRYCGGCTSNRESQLNDLHYSEAEIAAYVGELAALIGVVPPANFWTGSDWLLAVEGVEARGQLLDLAARRPTQHHIKNVFGSWLAALAASGVLPDGVHKTVRGIRSIAADGHVCLSIAERSIDDWLTSYGIEHEKEPAYPEGNFRGDFRVGDSIIEFFGLIGDPGYDARVEEKRRVARKHQLDLVEVYPADMLRWPQTQKRLAMRLGFDPVSRERTVLSTRPQRDLSEEKPAVPQKAPAGAPEGWYADPSGRATWRWWDGQFWSHLTRDAQEPYSDTAFPGRTDPPKKGRRLSPPTLERLLVAERPRDSLYKNNPQEYLESLYRLMDTVENAARGGRYFLNSMPFSRAAALLRDQRNLEGEAAIYARWVQGKVKSSRPARRLAELTDARIPANPVAAGMCAYYPSPKSSNVLA